MILTAEDLIPELLESYTNVGRFINSLSLQINEDGSYMNYSEHLLEVIKGLDYYGTTFIKDLHELLIEN